MIYILTVVYCSGADGILPLLDPVLHGDLLVSDDEDLLRQAPHLRGVGAALDGAGGRADFEGAPVAEGVGAGELQPLHPHRPGRQQGCLHAVTQLL